ncbi:MAG: 30S ribosome-binding factor RbfA [Eubacterium sp.]|nr:30S ribosome-binding factor RbfA [Eubacterium sp.]MBR0119660.1 30S ribosome-binding factor RbfA [Eubacterium sp.]
MGKHSVKSLRINGEVQKEMSIIIRDELKDPRIAPMTSVTDVEVTTDLKYAKIYVSVFGDADTKEKTLQGLRSSASYARHLLAKSLNLRNTPELEYKLDESMEYGAAMSKRIDEVISHDEEVIRERGEETDME